MLMMLNPDNGSELSIEYHTLSLEKINKQAKETNSVFRAEFDEIIAIIEYFTNIWFADYCHIIMLHV